MTERTRGTGSLFQRPRSPYWWAAWTDAAGTRYQVSTRTTKRTEAERFLRARLAEADRGESFEARASTLTFEDLHQLLVADYEAKGQRLRPVRSAWQRLAEVFAGERAVRITEDRLDAYKAKRLKAGYAAATVRQDFALLRRAFRLALRKRLLARMPSFPTVHVGDNSRKGFLSAEELERLCASLPDYLAPVARFGYLTGWRVQSEVLTLTWADVDFTEGWVNLPGARTKNKQPRAFPMGVLPPLRSLLVEQRRRADALEQETGLPVRTVFFHLTGARRGQPVRTYTEAWRAATAKAGLAGRVMHDLRRCAVLNLERAGVPRSVATKLTGHLTESVFVRYAVPQVEDLAEAVRRLAVLTEGSATLQQHSRGIVGHLRLSK